MALSVVMANKVLDALFNQANLTADTSIWLSLHTSDPGTTGANEVSDAGYARIDVTADFPAAASGSVANNVVITFGTAVTGYTATHYGLWTAVTSGSFRHGGDVNPDVVVAAGNVPQIASGQLVITA